MVILFRAGGATMKGITIWTNQGEQTRLAHAAMARSYHSTAVTQHVFGVCTVWEHRQVYVHSFKTHGPLELCRGVRTKERRVVLLEDLRDVRDQSRETKTEVMNRMECKEQNPVPEGLTKAMPGTDIGHSPCNLISIRELAKRPVTASLALVSLPQMARAHFVKSPHLIKDRNGRKLQPVPRWSDGSRWNCLIILAVTGFQVLKLHWLSGAEASLRVKEQRWNLFILFHCGHQRWVLV